jgi:hypothetical protein
MAGVWVAVLALSAVLMGWATAAYLRRANPTEHIPLVSFRLLPRGGPGWARWLGALGSGGIVLAALVAASDDLALGVALVVGGTVLSLLVQAGLLQRHNQQLRYRP